MIAGRGERFEHTHDLSRLLNLATQEGATLPVDADALIELTQYSVPLRYEDLLDAEPLDRVAAIAMIEGVGRWSEAESSA